VEKKNSRDQKRSDFSKEKVNRVFFFLVLKRLKEKIEFFNSIFLILIRSKKKKEKERNLEIFIYTF